MPCFKHYLHSSGALPKQMSAKLLKKFKRNKKYLTKQCVELQCVLSEQENENDSINMKETSVSNSILGDDIIKEIAAANSFISESSVLKEDTH